MDCVNPMLAVRVGDKYKFVGAVKNQKDRKYWFDTTGEKFILLPCGQCYACRLNKSKDWATRCVLEAKMHDKNCFVTLTYNDEHLPKDLSLQKDDFVKFMKRLRKNTGEKIRFYMAGEYGSLYQRPHYHACLFGYRPDDLQLYTIRNGINLYTSATLEKAWQYRGFVTVGDVTYESAAYVARYVMKKITGDKAEEYYNGREPDYNNMSRMPGIGTAFFEKYGEDIYNKDFVVIRNGIKCKPPRFFDNIYDRYYGEGAFDECVKDNRIVKSVKNFNQNLDEFTLKRIVTRARVKELKGRQLKRVLDDNI